MPAPLGALLTAMVTPFRPDGGVDLDAARRLAHHLVETGSDGIVVSGTTGEGPTLSDREKLDLFEAVVTEVGAGATVVANTGTYDTHHSAALTRSALGCGVDAFLVVTPYYSKPPEAGIVRHFEVIAHAAEGRPVVVYNIPQRVVLNLSPDTLIRLGRIENVVAVKQATPDLDQARRVVEESSLALYAGNDDLLLPFTVIGGAGGICVASHVAGTAMRDLVAHAHAGELDEARRIDDALHPLLAALAVTTNPIPIKAALQLLGHDVGDPRLPLVPADSSQRAELRRALAGVAGLVAQRPATA